MKDTVRGHVPKIGLMVGSALVAGVLSATPQTRSDIEGVTVPSGWDASARTTYQVEVAEETFDWFDSRPKSVEEFLFDLYSFPRGHVIFFR